MWRARSESRCSNNAGTATIPLPLLQDHGIAKSGHVELDITYWKNIEQITNIDLDKITINELCKI